MSEYHNPVLLEESVSALIGDASGVYADATFGGGGHSALILSRLSRKGKLLAFDRDADALENVPKDKRLTLIHNNFRFIHNFALLHGVEFDGILADLGVSSHQFDTQERGFSFRFDSKLDMRMNAEGERTAADVVNDYPVEKLEEIFRLYGELENPGRVAKLIDAARKQSQILTTGELNNILRDETEAGREAGGDNLPLPGGPDGQELHKDRQHRRQRAKGYVRKQRKPAEGR